MDSGGADVLRATHARDNNSVRDNNGAHHTQQQQQQQQQQKRRREEGEHEEEEEASPPPSETASGSDTDGSSAGVDSRDTRPETQALLMQYALKGDRYSVINLLKRDPHAVEPVGAGVTTPLHVAARLGRTGVGEALCVHGADANARDELGNTPAHVAELFDIHSVNSIMLRTAKDPPNLYARNAAGMSLEDLHCMPPANREAALAAAVAAAGPAAAAAWKRANADAEAIEAAWRREQEGARRDGYVNEFGDVDWSRYGTFDDEVIRPVRRPRYDEFGDEYEGDGEGEDGWYDDFEPDWSFADRLWRELQARRQALKDAKRAAKAAETERQRAAKAAAKERQRAAKRGAAAAAAAEAPDAEGALARAEEEARRAHEAAARRVEVLQREVSAVPARRKAYTDAWQRLEGMLRTLAPPHGPPNICFVDLPWPTRALRALGRGGGAVPAAAVEAAASCGLCQAPANEPDEMRDVMLHGAGSGPGGMLQRVQSEWGRWRPDAIFFRLGNRVVREDAAAVAAGVHAVAKGLSRMFAYDDDDGGGGGGGGGGNGNDSDNDDYNDDDDADA